MVEDAAVDRDLVVQPRGRIRVLRAGPHHPRLDLQQLGIGQTLVAVHDQLVVGLRPEHRTQGQQDSSLETGGVHAATP